MSRKNLTIILSCGLLIFLTAAAAQAHAGQDPYLSQRAGKAHQQPSVTGVTQQVRNVEVTPDPYLDQRMGKAHQQPGSVIETQVRKAAPGEYLSVRQKPSIRSEVTSDPYIDQRMGKAHPQR